MNSKIKKAILKIKNSFSKIPFGAKHFCTICNQRIQYFLPYRRGIADTPPFLRHMEIIGSDVENFSCPSCMSHDRERHLLMYLKASGILKKMLLSFFKVFLIERHERLKSELTSWLCECSW